MNLAYGGTTPSSLPSPATANYSAILVGDRTLVLQKTADPTVTVATLTFTIVLGNDHTVYAQGGAGGGAITGFVTTDPTPAPPAGQVAVRIVNMSPTGGAMDFFVTAPNADLSTATPTAANVAYHGDSPYVNLPRRDLSDSGRSRRHRGGAAFHQRGDKLHAPRDSGSLPRWKRTNDSGCGCCCRAEVPCAHFF